ncbi:MAG: gliding motility-associated C-terminal domain-containing protein, partial [Bacteroidetes bacterium]|nr:gliding motility-associated C-terminal domain-containing protein [Bacteroidota bacterium]
HGLGVGAYDVTLWARDSMGCWTPATVKDAVRVVAVEADFTYDGDIENPVRVCVPNEYKFRNRTRILEPSGTSSIRGKEDSLVSVQWWFGNEFLTNRDSSILVDSAIHTYLIIDSFDASLKVTTFQGCQSFLRKDQYIKLMGPSLKGGTFTLEEDTGCKVFRVKTNIVANPGSKYSYLWEYGAGNTSLDKDFNDYSFLDHDSVGTWPVFVTIYDTLVFDGDTAICEDRLPRTNPDAGGEDTIWVTVLGLDPIKPKLNTNVICPGWEVELSLPDNPLYDKFDSLFWTIRGNNFTAETKADEITTVTFADPGKYAIELRGDGQWPICPQPGYDTVLVQYVKAEIQIDPAVTLKDSILANYNFLNKSLPAESYTWQIFALPDVLNPIDEFTRNINDTSDLRYEKFGLGRDSIPTDYMVRLIAKVGLCYDTADIEVPYVPGFKGFNFFSPNDDGINDWFELGIQASDQYQITIFNRWGEVVNRVTQDDDIDCIQGEGNKILCKFWDGTNFRTGAKAATGTYFYKIEYRYKGDDDDDEIREYHGTITLAR